MPRRWWLPLATLCLTLPVAALAAQAQPAAKQSAPRLDNYGDPLPDHATLRIGSTRLWLGREVAAMAFTADDKRLVTISPTIGGKVWDVATGKELVSFGAPEKPLCAISADGSLAAVIESATACRVYDTTTGREKGEFHGPWSNVLQISFSPNNQLLAAVDGQDVVHVWNLASGEMIRWWADAAGYRGPFGSLAFLPDGKTLAVGGGSQGIKLWDATNGRFLGDLNVKYAGQCLAFSRVEGKTLLIALLDSELMAIVDVATGEPLDARNVSGRHGDWISCVAFGNNGKTILTGWNHGRVNVAEVGAKPKQAISIVRDFTLDCQPNGVCGASVSHDGKKVATANGDGAIRFWDLESRKQINPLIGRDARLVDVQFGGDGKSIISITHPWQWRWVGQDENECSMLRIWDLSAKKANTAINLGGHPQFCQYALSGNGHLVSTYRHGELELHNLITGGRETVSEASPFLGGALAHYGEGRPLRLSFDGQYLTAEVSPKYPAFTVWDTKSAKVALSVALPQAWWESSWFVSADGRLHVAHQWRQDDSNEYRYALASWDIRTGKKVLRSLPSLKGVASLSFSPSARLLAGLNRKDGTVPLWETGSGKLVYHLEAGAQKSRCLAFSCDGRFITAGTEKGDILLWDVTKPKPIASFVGHRGPVVSVNFSPDDKRLVTASDDTTILVWDISAWTDLAAAPNLPLGKDAAKLWALLGHDDPGMAYVALGKLLHCPIETTALIRKQLKPAKPESNRIISSLIEELDSNRYAVREQAMARLQKLGFAAQAALEKTLAGHPPLEVRLRVQVLLSKLENEPRTGDSLQTLRALELLEMLCTKDAAELLETLSSGEPGAWLTQEATASLERVRKRATP